MSSPLRRICRNMERPDRKQRQRNRRAIARLTRPLSQGLAEIGKSIRLIPETPKE